MKYEVVRASLRATVNADFIRHLYDVSQGYKQLGMVNLHEYVYCIFSDEPMTTEALSDIAFAFEFVFGETGGVEVVLFESPPDSLPCIIECASKYTNYEFVLVEKTWAVVFYKSNVVMSRARAVAVATEVVRTRFIV